MPKFRKRTEVIEAFQWHESDDVMEVRDFYVDDDTPLPEPPRICQICKKDLAVHGWIEDATCGGRVCPEDWIVKEVGGICTYSPDMFKLMYEPVEETE